MMNKTILLFFSITILFYACDDAVLTPKPRGFPKVDFPEKAYKKFDAPYCNLTFNAPAYAEIKQDEFYFGKEAPNSCWFDIFTPQLSSKIHCSYVPLDATNTLDKMRGDAFKLANQHNVKANFIDELPINRPDGTFGMVFDIEGEVASPFQFYLTDGENHFLRGSLYFNVQSRPDSLAPILDFVKTDIMELVNTLKWERD